MSIQLIPTSNQKTAQKICLFKENIIAHNVRLLMQLSSVNEMLQTMAPATDTTQTKTNRPP